MPTSKRYSAVVELRLVVAGVVLQLSQVGPDHAILKVPAKAVESGFARIDVIVDQVVTSSKEVFLCHGISESSRMIPFL
jgi:hypothetical protein